VKNYLRIVRYLKPYVWPYFIVAMVCMLGYSATEGAMPFLVQWMMDDVFVKKNAEMLYFVPGAIIVIFVVRGALNFGQSYLSEYVGLNIVQDVRNQMMRHLQFMPLSFFSRHPSGTLISRIGSDATLLRSALTDSLTSFLKDTTSLIVLIVVAFIKDWFLASLAFVVFPASVLPVMRLSRKMKRFARRGQISTGTLTSYLQESIQGNRIVKAFGMEEYEISRFMKENLYLLRQSLRVTRIRGIVSPTMELFAAFGIASVVWYGGSSVIAGTRTPGDFFAFMTAMFLMYQPFKNLTRTYTMLHQGLAGAERVFEILDEVPNIADKPGARPATPLTRAVEFHDVSFSYGTDPVLSHVNLAIRAGEMVALVGMSGAGKSTLADLIPRFYDVSSGRITLDGVDIRDLTLESLRAQVGIVAQHTFLFNDTVRNNIAYGDPERSMDDIIAAAKAANAHDFVSAMPQGYDSTVGEMGMQLSGGQRQRLAIARALLKDAPILILDEATSSLDSESERLVQDALEKLMTTRTTLVVAHRLSTIRNADRIVVLVDGAVAEEGTHGELLAHNGPYSRLYNLQLLEGEEAQEQETVH
jgi:subfamily B ATP-binding cassette protein MsbA